MKINLLNYFEDTEAKVPDKIAVIDGEREFQFSQIKDYAMRLGTLLFELSTEKINVPIAVYLPKSAESVIADIGIMYSGNAYLNLDVKTPIPRIKAIIELIHPEIVITCKSYLDSLADIFDKVKIVLVEDLMTGRLDYNQELLENVRRCMIDTDPICIINTSGSTGTPKGVVLNHRSFIDFIEWAIETAGICDDEVMGCLSPIVFDIYSFELCVLMAKGGTMVLLQDSMAAFPVKMLQVMQDKKVNFIFWVPTIMINIANMGLLEKIQLKDLRTVWFAGEVFPTKQFNIWRKHYKNVKFVNLYGPIEITLDCTYYIVEREFHDDEPLPIGHACRNTQILLLNENNEKCKKGEEGELCVRGTSLAMGYYNNPEKTAAAFVQNPLNHAYPEIIYRTGDIAVENENGEILFKGRKDTLIKHSGYRIELGEIEHVIINVLKLVKNGCAIYDGIHKAIIFFYEAENKMENSVFRKSISEFLPKYMIPNKFIYYSSLPMNTNGKIDRLLLKKEMEEQDGN